MLAEEAGPMAALPKRLGQRAVTRDPRAKSAGAREGRQVQGRRGQARRGGQGRLASTPRTLAGKEAACGQQQREERRPRVSQARPLGFPVGKGRTAAGVAVGVQSQNPTPA